MIILEWIPKQNTWISLPLSLILTFLSFLLLLNFSSSLTPWFAAFSPFFCGFIYSFIFGAERMEKCWADFFGAFFASAILYVSYPEAYHRLAPRATSQSIVLFLMYYPAINIPYILLASLSVFIGGALGVIASIICRR